jgi:hypothetical protein
VVAVTPSLDSRRAAVLGRPVDLARVPERVVLLGLLAAILGACGLLARVGSDADWLVALGRVVAHRHDIPRGLPFAASPTAGWANPLVLAELIFAGLHALGGERGLMVAQLTASAAALGILARDARRGGADPIGIAGALGLLALGAPATLAIARVQMFSLPLTAILIALLRSERREPTRRIWLSVGLLALWANLHGGVLLGFGVLIAYLLLDRARRRPLESLAVALGGLIALGLTPALWRTGFYDVGLLTNAAARQGQGMWGPLSPANPLDVSLALVAGVLGIKAWRAGLPGWETALALALALLTIRSDRNGVWLLMLLAPPAARRLAPVRSLRALAIPGGLLGLLLIGLAVIRGPVPTAGSGLVPQAVRLAHGRPVLADSSLDEQVAAAGGRIWAGNPIDAFSRPVQDAYLAWLDGRPGGAPALAAAAVVLVTRGTPEAARLARTAGFSLVGSTPGALLYRRMPGAR